MGKLNLMGQGAYTNFKNQPGDVNGYIRFRGSLEHCPHHGLPSWLVVDISLMEELLMKIEIK
jgi:hypothetical protein